MITFNTVNKSFGTQQVLKDASFRISPGERVGIVGPNGSGKSTVFSLLVNELSADGGEITVPRGCRIGHMHQLSHASDSADTLLEYAEGGMHDLISIQKEMDNLERKLQDAGEPQKERDRMLRRLGELQTRFESMDGYSVRNRAETALSGLGFSVEDFGRPVKALSGGWQMRAELIRVLVARPEILLLDEPSNYLDIPAVEWLQHFLREFPGTMILISHDRHLLNSLTTTIIEIANATATRYAGNYDFYVADRSKRYEQTLAAHKNQGRRREQVEKFIERFRAKNTKASAVQSRIKMLERMEKTEIPQQLVSKGRIRIPPPNRCGREVARLENVGVNYDGSRWVLRKVDLTIERGNKIALVGLNGLGKTTLLRVLAGRLPPSEGKRFLGHKVTAEYQSQEFSETISESLSVFDAVRQAGSSASDQGVRSLLGGFGFSGDDAQKRVQVLSGGERIRLAFARMLINPPNFLLLDEPTTHLDVAAREALETALAEFAGTLCIVSHDIEFVRHIADTIVAMTPPGITRYPGGYDYYHDKLATETAPAPKEKRTVPSAKKGERRERAQVVQEYSKARRELKKELQGIEKRIEAFELEQATLLDKLNEDGVDYESVNRGLAEVQQKLNDYNRRWEAFAIELDELEQAYKSEKAR